MSVTDKQANTSERTRTTAHAVEERHEAHTHLGRQRLSHAEVQQHHLQHFAGQGKQVAVGRELEVTGMQITAAT